MTALLYALERGTVMRMWFPARLDVAAFCELRLRCLTLCRRFHGGYPQGAHAALTCRDIVASHQCRAVGLPCQSVDEVPHGFREVLCVILGADPVHAVRSMFVDGGPALVQPGRSEPLGEVTKPLLLLAGCCGGYAPP